VKAARRDLKKVEYIDPEMNYKTKTSDD